MVVPPNGFPRDGESVEVELTNGTKLKTDFVILATGQRPNNSLVQDLSSSQPGSLINPDNGFIRVKPTMQLLDDKYPNVFAVGDIADTGVQKAARPGSAQAAVVAKNIQSLIEGQVPENKFTWGASGIHLTLGLVSQATADNCGRHVLTPAIETAYQIPQPQPGRRPKRACCHRRRRVSEPSNLSNQSAMFHVLTADVVARKTSEWRGCGRAWALRWMGPVDTICDVDDAL